MRRVISAGLALALLTGIAQGQARQEAAATRLSHLQVAGGQDATQQTRRERQCRFQWVDRATWTDREERLTAECVVARWAVSGGLPKFLAVGTCESGRNRFAFNPNGPFLGWFQHWGKEIREDFTVWDSRVRAWMPRWWRIGPWTRWTNTRSQMVVTARMVAAGGWGPWSCA